MLVRSWNLFHGNASPPDRRSHLEDMVRLVTVDEPDVVLLQELPLWVLGHLERWSGMTAVSDAARPARLGPLPITAALGRALTSVNHGILRSAFTGQANATLIGAGLKAVGHDVIALNPRSVRRRVAHGLGLGLGERRAWAKERRICQAVRVELEGRTRIVVANLHATSSKDRRIPAAEIERAATWVVGLARADETVVLGGDFNVERWAPDGFSEPGDGLDQVLVRGARASELRAWPDERRRSAGILLSDHAPVELEVEIS